MPATYEPIATTTLGTAQSTIVFSGIPNTYTDLRLIFTGIMSSSSAQFQMYWNGNNNTGSYYYTSGYGDGNTTAGASGNSANVIVLNSPTTLSTSFPTYLSVDIFSYAGTTYKSCVATLNTEYSSSGAVRNTLGLFTASTASITSVTLAVSLGNFNIGSTATLYGIKAA